MLLISTHLSFITMDYYYLLLFYYYYFFTEGDKRMQKVEEWGQ